MIASVSQGGKKRDRSPSPEPAVLKQNWAEYVEEVALNDQAEDSTSGKSVSEDPFPASLSHDRFS